MITFNGDKEKSLTISGFEKGISESPTSGFFQMVNANCHASPGLLKSNFRIQRNSKAINWNGKSTTKTFTASDDGSGKLLLTSTSGTFMDDNVSTQGQAFKVVNSGGSLPGGLVAGTIYYARYISSTEIKVCTTLAETETGVYMNFVSAGSGTQTINPITPKKIVQFADTGQACIDSDGRVWFNNYGNWVLIDGNTAGSNGTAGAAYWKGFWFFFKGLKVDLISNTNLYNFNPTWINDWSPTGWTALSNSGQHITFVGTDNILYFCNGNYIGSVKERSGFIFDPTDPSTYLVNCKALDVPYATTSIEELRTDLVIGTSSNKAYFWDRISPSFTFPIILPEPYTFDMVNMDNIIYMFTGNSGTVYKTNGVSVDVATKIPEHLTNYYYSTITNQVTFNQADRLSKRIIFTASVWDATNNIMNAVWSYYPSKDILAIENTITEVTGSIFSWGALRAQNEKSYTVSCRKGSTGLYTTDDIISSTYDGNGNLVVASDWSEGLFLDTPASVTTEIFSLGTFLNTATINQTEISLAKTLTGAQSISIYYRDSISSNFTLLKTFDSYSTSMVVGSNVIAETPLSGIKEIQFKIVLGNGILPFRNTSVTTCPELKHIRFILG